MEQIQNQMISELRTYYETNRDKSPSEYSGSLPNFISGFEGIINESLGEASSSDDFVQKILGKMSADEKKIIKDRIKATISVSE